MELLELSNLVGLSVSLPAVRRAEDVEELKPTEDDHQEVVGIHHGRPHLQQAQTRTLVQHRQKIHVCV